MGRSSSIMLLAPEVRERLELDLLAEPVGIVADRFGVSASAIYRWKNRSLAPRLRDALSDPASTPTTTLVERVEEILNDLRLARRSLLRSGGVVAGARAADSELRAIGMLVSTLGIDSDDTIELLKESRDLARAVGRAVRRSPEISGVLVEELREGDMHEHAESLSALALQAALDVSRNEQGDSK